VLLYMAAILTLWSMVLYLRAAWPSLLGRRSHKAELEHDP
jgi:CDP-diacylglycerol---glycerol-3-phosphate 3-phosphatidyltransferase